MAKHPLGVESTYSAPAQEQLLPFPLQGAQFALTAACGKWGRSGDLLQNFAAALGQM